MSTTWDRYQQYLLRHEQLGFALDISRMRFPEDFLPGMETAAQGALEEMRKLEAGAIANPDENRMVGHYWLRAPQLAPTPELRQAIEGTVASIRAFAAEIHGAGQFTEVLVVGIGGSALGPQFISDALGTTADKMRLHFLDNTDPDGFDRMFAQLEGRLDRTLTLVISKSGGTKETRNGMVEVQHQYTKAGLDFGSHAVAITGDGSELDKVAVAGRWRQRFPMWDWVGGRTSVLSAVGLVPLALQGLEIEGLLAGAAAMDEWTRTGETRKNPALLLALMWYYAGDGRGAKDMVVLPYKDRLVLFSKYLQQLVMESLGKEQDRAGQKVCQGLAVYGNKGSTDQHAYVQQLRDGVHNFFATFIEVREDRTGAPFETEPGITSGDYLQGFLRGTRTALYENGRDSITVSVPSVSARTVGALIALYDRAVGLYGALVNVNAYHQPGVEAGKKAATAVLELQLRVRQLLAESAGSPRTAGETASLLPGADTETVFHILQHLAANHPNIQHRVSANPAEDAFVLS